jgi:carbonic anhydrase
MSLRINPSLLAALALTLPLTAAAAPTWQSISSEPGKRIELDRTSIKREGQSVETVSRMTLDKELVDMLSGSPYLIIEVLTRYDCATRSANTLKRSFKKSDNLIVREETLNGASLPVRSGTLDDKVLREVCRPPKDSQAELAAKADKAASQLRQANDALLKKEPPPPPAKVADASIGEAKKEPAPSIRPDLKPAAETAKAQPPASDSKPPAASAAPPRPQARITTTARNTNHGKATGGYMLELLPNEPPKPPQPQTPAEWSYDGAGAPENWASLDPRYALCASGQRQSPIDIRDGIKVDVEPIQFNYHPSRFRIIDTGHAIEVFLGDNSFTLTGKTYALQQIRFHHPAEEQVAGRRPEMSAHLLHRADDGQMAVVTVLFERGPENPFIQTLWNYLPLEKNLGIEPPNATVDLDALLPAMRHYYTYMGSLTTPPCSEGVLWLVLKQPMPASQQQIDILARLYDHNARPIQPTADRLIKESR